MIRFVKWPAAALAGLALCACATGPDVGQTMAGTDCGAPAGWEQVAAAAEGKVLIFGETHGTNEIPDAFARYVCAASTREGRTLVMLELDIGHEAAMTAASDAADPHTALLIGMPKHWASRDGRGSLAMLGMMETLIGLRQSGRDLTILPMQQMTGWPEGLTPEERYTWLQAQPPSRIQQMGDAGMAERIVEVSGQYDRTIVLVGGIHARKAELEALPGVSLMAMQLPNATSLRILDDGGTAWVWTKDVIGAQTQYNSNPNEYPANSMALVPGKLPAYPGDVLAYDGYLSVGPVTASPPALSESELD